MKIKGLNQTDPLSHLLLSDINLSMEVADTEEWKELGELNYTLSINGVESDPKLLVNFIERLYGSIEKGFALKYDAENFDQRVSEEAERLLAERADKVLEKLDKLKEILEDPSLIIEPYWKR